MTSAPASSVARSFGRRQFGAGNATADAETAPAYALITQPVGKIAPADYAQQLAAAKTSGEISNVVLIKSNPSVEGPVGIASLAVVEFPNNAAFDKWSSEAASKLDTDLIVRRADLLVDDRAKTVAKNLAYVVSRYGAAYTGQGIYRLYQSLYHA